jgi:hypothetical protein
MGAAAEGINLIGPKARYRAVAAHRVRRNRVRVAPSDFQSQAQVWPLYCAHADSRGTRRGGLRRRRAVQQGERHDGHSAKPHREPEETVSSATSCPVSGNRWRHSRGPPVADAAVAAFPLVSNASSSCSPWTRDCPSLRAMRTLKSACSPCLSPPLRLVSLCLVVPALRGSAGAVGSCCAALSVSPAHTAQPRGDRATGHSPPTRRQTGRHQQATLRHTSGTQIGDPGCPDRLSRPL